LKISSPLPATTSRGSVQQGLSIAGGALGLFQLGLATDKRYFLGIGDHTMQNLWLRAYPSIFSLSFKNKEGRRISSGSAFKVGRFLVTNNHVVQIPDATQVVLRGVGADGFTSTINLSFGYLEFQKLLIDGDPEMGWDYAIYDIEDSEFGALVALELADNNQIEIGTSTAIFGYQFDQQHLSMHLGSISSQ
jgi:hypothetical protein